MASVARRAAKPLVQNNSITVALEISGSSAPDATRTLLASGRVCANAHYLLNSAMPWYDDRASMRTCTFLADIDVDIASMDYWFYGDTALTGVSGCANVSGLASLRQAFNTSSVERTCPLARS